MVEVVRERRGPIALCGVDLRLGEEQRVRQVRSPEPSIAKVSPEQVHARQVASPQVRGDQDGTAQVGADQDARSQVAAGQVSRRAQVTSRLVGGGLSTPGLGTDVDQDGTDLGPERLDVHREDVGQLAVEDQLDTVPEHGRCFR